MVNVEFAAPLEDGIRDVIDIDLLRPRWMRYAACRGQGFDAWFPRDEVAEGADDARRVCASCPVRLECLDYALVARIRHGLWGGLSTAERVELIRQRRRQPRVAARPRYYACAR